MKKINGYFSVEAAIVIPMTVFLISALIYVGFYLYNQCICGQSTYIAALRGSQQKNAAINDVKTYSEKQLDSLLDNRLFCNTDLKKDVSVSTFEVSTSAATDIHRVISQLDMFFHTDFHIHAEKKVKRNHPAEYIRRNHNFKQRMQ